MRVFAVKPDEGYEWILTEDEFENELGAESVANTWSPPKVRLLKKDGGTILARADLPWFSSGLLVFREAAYRKVGHLFANAGEFLPLRLVGGSDELWMFHAYSVLDALDPQQSDLIRFPSGRVMVIKRHVFRPDSLDGATIFRIDESPKLFFTGEIVQVLQKEKLTGIRFECVWSSEE